MEDEKPTAAFILSLLAGIFIMIGATIYIILGAMIIWFPIAGFAVLIYGLMGLVWGILVLVGAIMMLSGKVKIGGILVLTFSILSIFGAMAGLIVGFILGLVGGILGITWKPARKNNEKRSCLKCGRLYSIKYDYCPYCGTPGEQKE